MLKLGIKGEREVFMRAVVQRVRDSKLVIDNELYSKYNLNKKCGGGILWQIQYGAFIR